VSESSSIDYDISLKLNGFEAQKCSYPFTYESTQYQTCVDGPEYSWCSPYPEYTNQTLNCDVYFQGTFDSCAGKPYTYDSCGYVMPNSIYSMKFTSCPSNPPVIKSVSVRYVSYSDMINITGSGFSSTFCENEIYIGK
jgi:hypothetical protein